MQDPSSRKKKIIIVFVLLAAVLLAIFGASHKTTQKPIAKTAEVSNNLNENLPIQTSHYRIDYEYNQASKSYTYQITLYAIINHPSQYDNYVAQLKQYKQEALDYIRAHKENPANLTITYVPDTATSL